MASLLFIVSRTKPGTYAYMKLVSESEHDVILDRRKVDRRRIHQRATPERRHCERRRRDITTDLLGVRSLRADFSSPSLPLRPSRIHGVWEAEPATLR